MYEIIAYHDTIIKRRNKYKKGDLRRYTQNHYKGVFENEKTKI